MTTAQHILQDTFGYRDFRHPQEEVVDTVIAGGDALVLMPTGGGKSLCYQVPALVRAGCGVVVSPLIALMQDQVDALTQLGVRASYLNSTLSPATAARVEESLLRGELDLLYVAPERLLQPRCLELLHRSDIALFAIDEAHCVSQWGHDFRADYLQLSILHQQFPAVPRIALTATADERTRSEIISRLDLGAARQFIVGFDRPNIRYRIGLKQNPRQQLLRFLKEEHPDDAGIVYCMSRKKTEETATWLSEQGFNALPYHAGLSAQLRATHQSRFLREDAVVIVATIAFGMGIDKPDVRFVAHLDLPKTVEAYYQETGRAGRDGEPADAWLIYGLQDIIKLRQMMEGSQGSEEHKRAEQSRLNAMLGLCEITSCRRQALLHYFGDDYPQPCGNCDCCLQPPETWDGTEASRMALSAAYRTGQRFGVNHLIDMLRGAETEKLQQFDHHLLPTYGIGKELDTNQWRSVFRQLVARGYLSVDLERFGALILQPKCRPLLKGDEQIQLRRDAPRKAAKRQSKAPIPEDINVELWEALRDCRRLLAEEQGVPPYVIFHDTTLLEMCSLLPADLAEFGNLNGVGERKLEKYGQEFLQVINQENRGRTTV
jgi:ATP-dependent DNA helicase RecQ